MRLTTALYYERAKFACPAQILFPIDKNALVVADGHPPTGWFGYAGSSTFNPAVACDVDWTNK